MPRKVTSDDELPRRRRPAAATVAEGAGERGLLLRVLLYSPKDMVAGLLAFAATSAIIANALFLQTGPHPAPIPLGSGPTIGSRRVAAVQRALTEYGYGQLKPTGTIGPDTQAAIQKFERERRLPMTGQLSDRLVHELAAAIGHPVD